MAPTTTITTISISTLDFPTRVIMGRLRRDHSCRNSLVVQWLGLHTLTAKGTGSIPGRGTKLPQAILQAKKKMGKKITTGREVAELFFAGDRIICLGNPIESTGKLLEMVRELNNLAK